MIIFWFGCLTVECLNDDHCSQPNMKCGDDGVCECKPEYPIKKTGEPGGPTGEGCGKKWVLCSLAYFLNINCLF